MLYYRGYKGSLSNVGDGYIGRIEEINKVLTYEGKSLAETENAFHKAVDCYIESKSQKRKKAWICTFVGILALFIILAATCPKSDAHKQKVSEHIIAAINQEAFSMSTEIGALSTFLFPNVTKYLTDNLLTINDYIIFSIGRVYDSEEWHIVSIGLFNHVFTTFSEEDIRTILNSPL